MSLNAITSGGGFSPLPLAIMAPFMAYQSAELGFAFGLQYEIGKRTIKSMSNDTFNSLSKEEIENLYSHNHDANLQAFINEKPKSDLVQKLVLENHLAFEKSKVAMNIELFKWTAQLLIKEATDPNIKGFENIWNQLFPNNTSPVPPTNDPSVPPSFTNPPATNLPYSQAEKDKVTALSKQLDQLHITMIKAKNLWNSGSARTKSIQQGIFNNAKKSAFNIMQGNETLFNKVSPTYISYKRPSIEQLRL